VDNRHITRARFLCSGIFSPFGQEDFFTNGMFYEGVTLFTGMVDKNTHYRILDSYNGRHKNQPLSWVTIRNMVREMFTDNYGGIEGSKINFNGDDSVCIFKYLVTESDPQHIYSLSILILNLVCFGLITGCYIVIQFYVISSSDKVAVKTSASRRRDIKLQTKVSIIIVTDFLCWIPFIVVSLLHFFEIIDVSSWYPLFSIVILPLNSVINPLLYSDLPARGIKAVKSFAEAACNTSICVLAVDHTVIVPSVSDATDAPTCSGHRQHSENF
jgi:uncharacterized membrane protein YciS (DUF1049 family)